MNLFFLNILVWHFKIFLKHLNPSPSNDVWQGGEGVVRICYVLQDDYCKSRQWQIY